MTTVFVTLCDAAYWHKAKRTIVDLRSVGAWTGEVVLVAVDFVPNKNWCAFYRVETVSFPRIPIDALIAAYKERPLSTPSHDRREFDKLTQWEKLHLFDKFFRRWERVVFLDAGTRILSNVSSFLSLDWRGRFLAQDDTWNSENTFGLHLELKSNPDALARLTHAYGSEILASRYFLNGLFVYDTKILDTVFKAALIDVMNAYPLWRTNEMGVMNVVLHFQHALWTPFPLVADNGKFLYDWCELNRAGTTWLQYCALKYPVTISMECE
jgi:hypothetical protein